MKSHSVVSTSDPIATQATLAVLNEGGSVFDAALCASMVLSVTLPMSTGIGGDGVFLMWDSEFAVCRSIEAIGIVPSATEPIDAYLRTGRQTRQGLLHPKVGILTASVPALPWGWAILAGYCRLDMARITRPAIELARQGFVPDLKFRRWVKTNFSVIAEDKYLRDLFEPFSNPEIAISSKVFKQEALGTFLDLFARTALDENPAWAQRLREVVSHASTCQGGVIVEQDFLTNKLAREDWPIEMQINNHCVLTSGSTTQGYMALLAARLMQEFDLSDVESIVNDAKIFHVLYQERLKRLGDHGEKQQQWLTSEMSTARVSELYEMVRALDFRTMPRSAPVIHDGDTTYFYVKDTAGNAMSCIQSISIGFGSGVSAADIGLIFNSRLTRGISLAKHAPNPLTPHTRPVNTILPTLGLIDNKLVFFGGTAGGDMQVQLNAKMIYQLTKQRTFDYILRLPRWKYSPVSDMFDTKYGNTPTIITEAAFSETDASVIQQHGLAIKHQADVGGALKFAVYDRNHKLDYIDEPRDGGLTALLN